MASNKIALVSVSDKTQLDFLVRNLHEFGYKLIASGGTAKFINNLDIPVVEVSDITRFPELLGGRVKTLHPKIHAGILARDDPDDEIELVTHSIEKIDLVVCNLYAFIKTVKREDITLDRAIEKIDIGGVTLLRAAAKNHRRVTVVSEPKYYEELIEEIRNHGKVSEEMRQRFALSAFEQTAEYDCAISDYFRKQYSAGITQFPLRYGMNPHQTPAQMFIATDSCPLKVLNGNPGYINLLDALNAWQLVRELRTALGLPAAASFKHVSPAGAAVAVPFENHTEAKVCMVEDVADLLSPQALAYARARGADRISSFGDFAALSDECDVSTAQILAREVSDGVIAPKYDPAALEILKQKKSGTYCILQIDPDYEPKSDLEQRNIFGFTLEQKRNTIEINRDLFTNIKSKYRTELPETAIRDLIVATITLKYTQSNSVCFAKNGQVIGVGAGQQSRVHCMRLAAAKADHWWTRHHPKILALEFPDRTTRAEMSNKIDNYIIGMEDPGYITLDDRAQWMEYLKGVSVSTDAFFPFRDSIDRAVDSGVQYIAGPLGSRNDAQVLQACDEYGIVFADTLLRLFHH